MQPSLFRSSILTACFVGAVLAFACNATERADSKPRPNDLVLQIKRDGPQVVMSRLWERPEVWDVVLEHVASGAQEWLEVAALLHPATDAGSAEMLHEALADALEKEPERVLRMIGQPFDSDFVCFLSIEPYDTAREAIRALDRRIQRVAGVKHPELAAVRDGCVASLRRQRPEIERVYASDPHE